MKAIIKEKPGPGAAVRNLEIPQPGPKDVLIRVKAGAICGSGVHSYGIFSEFTTVPGPCAVKIPNDIPFVAAAMMEPCGVAVHGLSKGIVSGKTLAIFGCGPIGLFGVQAAVAWGAAKVYAIDISEKRLKMAASFRA